MRPYVAPLTAIKLFGRLLGLKRKEARAAFDRVSGKHPYHIASLRNIGFNHLD